VIKHEDYELVEGGLCRDGSDKLEDECNSRLTRLAVKWGNKGYRYPGEAKITRSNCGGRRISLLGRLSTQYDGTIENNVLSASDLEINPIGCYGNRNNVWIETTSAEAGKIYMKDGTLDVPSMVGTDGFINISASALSKKETYDFEVCDDNGNSCNVISFIGLPRCEDYSSGSAVVGGGEQPNSGGERWPWWYYLIIAVGCFLGVLLVILIIVLIIRCASAPKSTMTVVNPKPKTKNQMD
jgi:hypothetical protein